MLLYFFLRSVVKHSGAEAHLLIRSLQHVVVLAGLAAFPELRVIRQLRKGNRLIAQFIVDLHHGQPRCDAEDLGLRIFLS